MHCIDDDESRESGATLAVGARVQTIENQRYALLAFSRSGYTWSPEGKQQSDTRLDRREGGRRGAWEWTG